MKKFLFYSLLAAINSYAYGQIGIGGIGAKAPIGSILDNTVTTNPKGILHLQGIFYLNDSINRNVGLVLPKVGIVEDTGLPNVSTPTGGTAVAGTMVYVGNETSNTSGGCVKIKTSVGWQNCLVDNSSISTFFSYDVYGGLNVRVKKVSAGHRYSLVLGLDDKAVYAAGVNSSGRTGTGTSSNNTATFQLILPQNIIDVSAGYAHALASSEDGQLWAWGYGSYYRTGLGTINERYFPMKVKSGIPDGVKIVRVEAGYENSIVLGDDGKVYSFGNGAYGVNGISPTTIQTPTAIPALSNIVDISLSRFSGAAIDSAGIVYVWGSQNYGRLGNNANNLNTTTPVQILSNISVKQVVMGTNHGLAVSSDGKTLYGWGVTPAFGIGGSNPYLIPTDITSQIHGFDPDQETIIYVAVSRFDDSGNNIGGSIVITDKNIYAAGTNTYPQRLGLGYTPGTSNIIYSPNGSTYSGFYPMYNRAIYSGTLFRQASMGVDHSLMAQTVNGINNSGGYGYGTGNVDGNQLGAISTGFSYIAFPVLIKK